MKRLALLIIIILLNGCAPSLTHIPRQTLIVGFDFSKYSQKGFLITPGEYGENYETIGLLTFSIFPEANKKQGQDDQFSSWSIDKIDPAEVIELAYQEAIKRKADAITHFRINFSSKTYSDWDGFVELKGVEVSGLLIKRK